MDGFPVLIIDWKITNTLSFSTGRGLGATRGPGLGFDWKASDEWSFGLAGRYEKLRFRMNDSGYAPKGVGEDRAVPLYISATYRLDRKMKFMLFGGVEFAGRLRIEDENGEQLTKSDHDAAPMLGLAFSGRF